MLLRDELARLPAGQREAITLRFVVGLDVAAVAESLGVPEGTAKSHLHRGVERLRRRLARRSAAFAAVGVTTALARLPAVEGSVVAATAPSAIAVGTSTIGMLIMASSLAAVSFAVVAAVAPFRSPSADSVPLTPPPPAIAATSQPATAAAAAWDTQLSSTFDCTIGEALDRIAQRVGQRAPDPPRPIDRARHLELTVRGMRASDLVQSIHHLGRVGDDAAPRVGVVVDVQGGLAFFTYDAPPAPVVNGAPAGAGHLTRVAILGDGRGAHGTIAAVERDGAHAVVDVIAGSPRVGDVVVRLAHPDDIDPAVRDRLLQPATIDIQDAPLGSVVAFVQRLSAANILVDPRLGQVPPVSVRLREQPLIHALDLLPCAWRWVDGAIQLDPLPSVVGEPWRPQPDGAGHADDF